MAEASDNRRMVPARVPRAPTKIGALPEEILLRVMSHLTTREAVHTCLLAQYWRNLWRSVPCINVSIKEFDGEDYEDEFEREVAFKRFVDRLLMLRNPVALDQFRLSYSCSTHDSSGDANLWIYHVLQRNARDVQVINRFNALKLFPEAFTSSCLKRLHIGGAILVPGFFHQLQTNCTALEYMFLDDCVIRDLEIFSSTLKILILSAEVRLSFDPDNQVSISAPSLISLSMDHGFLGGRLPILNNMPSLKTASVSLKGDIKVCDADGIRQFLEGLSDVTSLDFSYWHRELTMGKNYRWCPTFSKLINLTLHCSCVGDNLYALIVFLQNSPKLKRLTLELGQGESEIAGELEDRSFTCEQLQIVEIIFWKITKMLLSVIQLLRAGGIRTDQMRFSSPI